MTADIRVHRKIIFTVTFLHTNGGRGGQRRQKLEYKLGKVEQVLSHELRIPELCAACALGQRL